MTAKVDVKDEDDLYRRIHPDHLVDGNRVSSSAFAGIDSYELSVDLARLSSPDECMANGARLNLDFVGVISFTAGFARSLQQVVTHDPLEAFDPGGPNHAHTLVIGHKDSSGRKVARAIARACRWAGPEAMVKLNP